MTAFDPRWLTFAIGASETQPGGEEGGLSWDTGKDNPTWRGIQLDEWREWRHDDTLDVEDMQRLLWRTEIGEISDANYWRRYHVDLLPAGPNVLYQDGVFNGGGVENLQTALNVLFAAGLRADNELGPVTLAAMQRYLPICNPEALINAYANASEIRYRSLGRFSEFGTDWLERLGRCQQLALKLADNKPPSAA
jgi:lysozyme family protein